MSKVSIGFSNNNEWTLPAINGIKESSPEIKRIPLQNNTKGVSFTPLSTEDLQTILKNTHSTATNNPNGT
jgi:hypothetical protein